MKALIALLSALGGFFLLLNTFGGIVSGVWLAVLGNWAAIGMGVALIFVSPFLLGIALLPSMALGAGAYASRRSKIGILFFGLLSNLYIAALITAWCVAMLVLFVSRATDQSLIPLLIWSYGAATGPWAYMASQESRGGGGDSSVLAVIFAQIGYLVMVAVGILGSATLLTMATVLAAVMLLYVGVQMLTAITSLDEMQRDLV